jgi:hypothetical protein
MGAPTLQRLPRNSRPSPEIPPQGLSPPLLLAACRADPRWPERAAAVEEAWLFEPPCPAGPPIPLAEADPWKVRAGIGAYGRWLEARRQARRAEMHRAEAEKIDAGPPAEAAGERSDPPPSTDTPALSRKLIPEPLSMGYEEVVRKRRQPQKNRYGKRRLVPRRRAA